MDPYKKYIIGTVTYSILAILGIDAIVVFALRNDWFLTSLAVIFTYVALDNFFCGSRAKACAIGIRTHYILPWRIKRKS